MENNLRVSHSGHTSLFPFTQKETEAQTGTVKPAQGHSGRKGQDWDSNLTPDCKTRALTYYPLPPALSQSLTEDPTLPTLTTLSCWSGACSPWGSIRAFTGALAAFTISFSIFRSSSPTRDTERPALPARAVRPTRWT